MKVQNKFALLVAITLIGLVAYILLQTNQRTFIYTNFGAEIPSDYPLFGIDVSRYQGEINYEEAVQMTEGKDSISFVYIKATEGQNYKDPNYDTNAEGFAKYGMNYGFYHFYKPDKSAKNQAHFFSETIKGYNFKLIPVLDIEEKGSLSSQRIVDSVTVFLNEVEKLLGERPMIYTYASFYSEHFKRTAIANELFWIASYTNETVLMDKDNVIMWQFTDSGTINGIKEKVDLNVGKKSFVENVIREKYR